MTPTEGDVEFVAASCSGKSSFQTYELADRVASRGRRGRGQKVFPYKCDWCSQWHIGTPKKERR